VLQFPMEPTRQNLTTLIMGAVPAIILWYETIRIWRDRPR